MEKHVVKIEFNNEETAKQFLSWMCDAGEQWWFQHCEDAGIENTTMFEYHHPQNKEFPHNDVKRYEGSKLGGEDGLTIKAAEE